MVHIIKKVHPTFTEILVKGGPGSAQHPRDSPSSSMETAAPAMRDLSKRVFMDVTECERPTTHMVSMERFACFHYLHTVVDSRSLDLLH